MENLKAFVDGYVQALLWSSVITVDDGEQEHADSYEPSHDLLVGSAEACKKFFDENLIDLTAYAEVFSFNYAGHDFALTRNRHGAGFWDREADKELLERLTTASQSAGEVHLYLGTANLLYIE